MCSFNSMHTINLSPLVSFLACAAVSLWVIVLDLGKRHLKRTEVAAMKDHLRRNYSRL
jgi:hypothetical protein